MTFELERVSQERAHELERMASMTVFYFNRTILIDRERDLIFLDLGGKGDQPKERNEPPNYWCLIYKGESVRLTSRERFERVSDVDYIYAELETFSTPLSLKNQLFEVQETIIEAFASYYSLGLKRTMSASVQFPPVVFR